MRRTLYMLLLLSCVCATAQTQCVDTLGVRSAVSRMLGAYPHSTLQDVYKSFFQERFGPGHIVSDTAQAAAWLRNELGEVESVDVPMYEPTGYCGKYYRVALALVASGRVSFDSFFSAFLRSVRVVQPSEIVAWAAEWEQIEGVISTMGLSLPGYEEDAAAISEMLATGHYAVHHSSVYNEYYAPHYRIIAKEIFINEIMPLLEEKGGRDLQ